MRPQNGADDWFKLENLFTHSQRTTSSTDNFSFFGRIGIEHHSFCRMQHCQCHSTCQYPAIFSQKSHDGTSARTLHGVFAAASSFGSLFLSVKILCSKDKCRHIIGSCSHVKQFTIMSPRWYKMLTRKSPPETSSTSTQHSQPPSPLKCVCPSQFRSHS